MRDLTFEVTYPDATEGTCSYERLGPAYHRFEYRYRDGAHLSRTYRTLPLGNTPPEIAEAGKASAEKAFFEAVEHERKDYFARVTEPTDGSRKKKLLGRAMEAFQAKRYGGRYAVCLMLPESGRAIRVTQDVATIREANALWVARGRIPSYAACCCNRMDRRWEMPKYNPMYADPGYPERQAPR